ncbi:MAG: aldolase [Spirochaetales bacterium]|jgi:2-keto-3-deoxy-L-rhamnonate aldolase RhmA|nr:aldolase [Spirochaetales bacterium]
MQGNQIRAKLRSGERVYGTHMVEAGNPNYLLWMAETAMDFAFICTEHIPIDRKEVSWMCQLLVQKGISPIVRIPYPDAYLTSMVLDGGAEGIVAPYVETTQEVEDLIGAVRYRPIKGEKLSDMMSGRKPAGEKLKSYLEGWNRNNYLIIGIESVTAMNRLEELLNYDEVDGVFLGPHDITCSMEIPEEYDNPLFIAEMKKVIDICKSRGKGVGLHQDHRIPAVSGLVDYGLNWILNASDIVKAKNSLTEDYAEIRSRFGDTYEDPLSNGESAGSAAATHVAARATNTGEIT